MKLKRLRNWMVLFLFWVMVMLSSGMVDAADFCPELLPPEGTVLIVDPADNLQDIVANAEPGTTILLEAGLYSLGGSYLRITADGLSIRGLSGDRGAVVLDGGYLSAEIIQVAASNVTLADLTIKRAANHPVHVSPASGHIVNTLIYNVRIVDPGQQAIKINPNGQRTYFADHGEIACSLIELTDIGRSMVQDINGSCYTGGIDAHQARGWLVRDNEINGFWCQDDLSEHAIHFWRGSRDTVVMRNTLTDNVRGIGFGLVEFADDTRTYGDDPCPGVNGYIGHYGGVVLNNYILQTREELHQSEYGFDSGIALAQSCAARLIHNSVVSTSRPFSSIEYRFSNTSASIINNLATHTILQREGAVATLAGNATGASLDNFINPYEGNLHLFRDAVAAINLGVDPGLGEYGDADGQIRMQPPDVGADENNPGDINGDGAVGLEDTIMCLKMLSGLKPAPIYSQAEITGNGRIAMVDALYTLQAVAELFLQPSAIDDIYINRL